MIKETAPPPCNNHILKHPTHFKYKQLQLQWDVEAESQVLLKPQISEEETKMKNLVIPSHDFFCL